MITIIKKSLISACYSFTALTVLYSLLMICIYDTSEGINMSAITVFNFFPLSFFISIANSCLKSKKLSGVSKLFIHFVIVTLSIILFIFIPHGGGISSGSAMLLFTAYVFIYFVAVLIYNLLRKRKKALNDKKTEYKKVY
jgi:hypothetical protein